MKLSVRSRLIAGLTALLMAGAGAVVATPARAEQLVCNPGMTFGCEGELPGGLGKYDLKVPANFNGTVLVYFHGYKFSPNSAVPGPIGALGGYDKDPTYTSRVVAGNTLYFGNGTAEITPGNNSALITQLLDKGYALAGVGYGTNQGWATMEGVAAGNALIAKIRGGFVPNTERVVVWGHSLGGLISQHIAETNTAVNGAVPMCGAFSNALGAMKMATDVLYVMRVVGGLPLKITYSAGQAGYGEAVQDLTMLLGVLQTIASAPATAPQPTTDYFWTNVLKLPEAGFRGVKGVPLRQLVLLAGLIAGVPEASKTYDGITTAGAISVAQASSMAAVVENISSVAVIGVLARFELESRARVAGQIATGSANFIDNVNTDYVAQLTDVQLAQYEFLLNIGPALPVNGAPVSVLDQLDNMLAALAATKGVSAARLPANPAAVAAINAMPQLTGKVRVPTVSIHTEIDPVTPAGNLLMLQTKVREANAAARQAWIDGGKKGPKPKGAPFFGFYADAPDDGWTTFGPTGINAIATANNRASGVGHCGADQSPTVTAAQHIGAIDAVNTWLTKGEAAGRKAINQLRYNPLYGIQVDRFWEPEALKGQ